MPEKSIHDEENVPLRNATDSRSPPSIQPSFSNDFTKKSLFTWPILSNMLIFFFAMIVMELALEAATRSFSDLKGISSAVTLFQFGYCFLLPMLVSKGKVFETFPSTAQEVLPYFKLSLLVFGATALATQSVQYVSYPTKVVFKSAKLIPTMVVAALCNKGSKYGVFDYLAASCLCLGAAGFSYAAKSSSSSDDNQSMYGISLLIVAIVCDALVPNIQQQLMNPDTKINSVIGNGKNTSKTGLSAAAVMLNVNVVGFVGVTFFMIFHGSLMSTMNAAFFNPWLLFYLNIVGLGLSTAVLAYTRLIKASSSVTAVTVATVRKVATVLLSYIVFPKPLNMLQVSSLFLVFAGVVIASFTKKR